MGRALARFAVMLAGGVVLAQRLFLIDFSHGVTAEIAITVTVIVAGTAIAGWMVEYVINRAIRRSRDRSAERVVKLPVSDVTKVSLSGRTLTVRAPFDRENRSDRWRLRLETHEQGESLVALLGRRQIR